MRKRLLGLAILFPLLILGFGAIKPVSAQGNVINVSPELTTGTLPGNTFSITVNIVSAADLYAYGFKISWERLLINADSIDLSDNILAGQPEGYLPAASIQNNYGYLIVSVSTVGDYNGVYGDGLLATITFSVAAEKALSGLHLYDIELIDSTLASITGYTTQDGYFSNVASRTKNFAVIITEGTWQVGVETNTYITGFSFNKGSKTITFNSTWADGTASFSNVTIPNDLLGGPYIVVVDGNDATPTDQPTNDTHSFLYFTYTTSTRNIIITGTIVVSEFPTTLLLPIFIVITITATVLYRFSMVKRKRNSD